MTAPTKSGHAEAYRRWFAGFERERKARRIAPGRRVSGFPEPPAGPDEVRFAIDRIGEARAIEMTGAHRTTVGRWLSGAVQIPLSAWRLLRFAAEGVPPGCGDAWRGFQWEGDALLCPDGRTRVTAHEIAGLHYQRAHIDALQQRAAELERQVIDLARRLGSDGAANDGYTVAQDVRSRAFSEAAR